MCENTYVMRLTKRARVRDYISDAEVEWPCGLRDDKESV